MMETQFSDLFVITKVLLYYLLTDATFKQHKNIIIPINNRM